MGERQEIASAPKEGWFLIELDFYGVTMGRRSLDPAYAWEFFDARNPTSGTQPNATSCHAHGWWQLPTGMAKL